MLGNMLNDLAEAIRRWTEKKILMFLRAYNCHRIGLRFVSRVQMVYRREGLLRSTHQD